MNDILQDLMQKIKGTLSNRSYFTALILILVAVTAFGLGRQSIKSSLDNGQGGQAAVGQILTKPANTYSQKSADLPQTYYVASKEGQVYHLPHCSGAKRISEANKITFKTKEEAEAAGLRPAANCKGI